MDNSPDRVVDNDLVLKAVCYGLTAAFWPGAGAINGIGVLGSARYVVGNLIDRAALSRSRVETRSELAAFLSSAKELEPGDREISLAAEIEAAAQRDGLALDTGESVLLAMTVGWAATELESGDKRAIRGIEHLIDVVDGLSAVAGRVRCLEQIVRRVIGELPHDELATAICAEPAVDKALSFCFSCHSDERPPVESIIEGLDSYIADLRKDAPRVLVS
jgi:hypothetical protein